MDEPLEIRNQIYTLIYVKPTYIGGAGAAISRNFRKEAVEWRNLDFAVSCRQVYEESSDIFFAKNGFEFHYAHPALEFLMSIGMRGRSKITKLKYHQVDYGSCFEVCRYLKSCTALRDLQVSFRTGDIMFKGVWWDFPVENSLEFFLGDSKKLCIGEPQASGPASDLTKKEYIIQPPKDNFLDQLLLVKREEFGEYTTFKCPDVFADEACRPKLRRFVGPSKTARKQFSDMSHWLDLKYQSEKGQDDAKI